MILPQDLFPLPSAFAPAFSRPTWDRFQLLMAVALLATDCRTVANLLRTLGHLAAGPPPGNLAGRPGTGLLICIRRAKAPAMGETIIPYKA